MGLFIMPSFYPKSKTFKTVIPEREFHPEKWCPQCRQYLRYGMFANNRTTADGKQKQCRECQAATKRFKGAL